MELFNTLGGILAISSISAALAAVLVVAGRYLNNYGECTVTITGVALPASLAAQSAIMLA